VSAASGSGSLFVVSSPADAVMGPSSHGRSLRSRLCPKIDVIPGTKRNVLLMR